MRQVLKESRLNALLGLISEREMSVPVRNAVRFRIVNGYTYRLAATKAKVSRAAVIRAIQKLLNMDKVIRATYLDERDF